MTMPTVDTIKLAIGAATKAVNQVTATTQADAKRAAEQHKASVPSTLGTTVAS